MPRIKTAGTKTAVPVSPMPVQANVVVPTPSKNLSSWGDIPSDMLLEIASYLRDDRHALLSLTDVCTYWCQVLVECPLNWTQISTEYPRDLFKLWLQRSKNVPIDAEISSLPIGLLPLLRSNNTSFRSLRCKLNKKNLLMLFGGLKKVSPNLERLELCRTTAEKDFSITLKFISGSMPSLRDLRLTHINPTREILNLRCLVHLELVNPHPSLTAILDLVASNPRLETIVLCVRCAGQTDPRPKGAVLIPRLRTLEFDFYSPLPLFHQLSIPRGASVSFSVWDSTRGQEVILPDSLEHLQNLSEVRNLYVQRKHRHLVEASGPSGEVKFENIGDPLPELRRLPLELVEKFRYAEDPPSLETHGKELDRTWIFKTVGRLRNLQTLVIGCCGLEVMKIIFCLLSPQIDRVPGVPPRRGTLPCPTLSTVVLEAPRDGTWNEWITPFLDMLYMRAAAGSRLKKVRIVTSRGVHVPRPGEAKRRQMAKLVPWVEVKSLWYENDGEINEQRAEELFEWQHGGHCFSRGGQRAMGT